MSNHEETQEQKSVTYGIFILAMSVILMIFGYLFVEVAKVQSEQGTATTNNTNIAVQLSQIQTDLAWVKERLSTSVNGK